MIKKCNSNLFLLSRIKVCLSRRNRILFYNSYILPHLDFCCIIWGNCSSTLEDKLSHSNLRLWFLYTILRTIQRTQLAQKAILMYSIINNICPDYLKNYVSYTSDISCRDTRFTNCNQLYTPTFPQVIHVLWSCHLEFSPPTC